MSIHRTQGGARRHARTGLGAALLALAALAGCDQIGNPITALGGAKPTPDEFRVLPRKPLIVPEGLAASGRSLPPPEPGRPSPLEPDPGREAVTALLGAGTVARPEAAGLAPSAGEAALLSSAAARAADPNIRAQLEQDRVVADRAAAEAPYKPPTVAELLGFSGDDEDEVDPAVTLDPVAESQRLQREGVVSAYDPRAESAEEAAATAGAGTGAPAEPYYPSTTDRRPTNRLETGTTAPRFE